MIAPGEWFDELKKRMNKRRAGWRVVAEGGTEFYARFFYPREDAINQMQDTNRKTNARDG